MKRQVRSPLGTAALTIAGVMTASGLAHASSHREAPLIADDPAADNTDVYAWVSPGSHDTLYIVANYIPLEEPSGGPNFHGFSDDVRYEINIARGNRNLNPQIQYFIHFDTSPVLRNDPADLTAPVGGGKEFFSQLSGRTQTYRVIRKVRGQGGTVIASGVPVAPINIGPRTFEVVQRGNAPQTSYDDAFAAGFITNMSSNQGRVWAGPRDDGFYVDLGGVFDLANLRGTGVAQDGVSGFNTHSIVLEIPTTLLTENGQAPGNSPSDRTTLGIWASASRRKTSILKNNGRIQHIGPWTQVSRLGIPLVNEALIGLQDKDKYNRTDPKHDVANFGAYFLNPVVVRDAEAVGIYAALGVDPTPFKSNRTDILDIINLKDIPTVGAHSVPLSGTGDVLRVDMATDSGFPNGRPIPGGAQPNMEQADVTDVLLSVILAGGQLAISDGVNYNDKPFLPTMPFLPLPHRGYDEGHGTPTP